MKSIHITMAAPQGGNLAISADMAEIGTQYDNYAKQLVFERPDEYKNDSLMLYFRSGMKEMRAVDNGISDCFPVGENLTDNTRLSVQAGFRREGVILVRSNVLELSLRPSIAEGEYSPHNLIEEAPVDGKAYARRNGMWDESGSGGGTNAYSPYIGSNGNWYEWDGTQYIDSGKSSIGEKGEPGEGGANPYLGEARLYIEGSRGLPLDIISDIEAEIIGMDARETPVAGARLCVMNGNFFDLGAVSPGKYLNNSVTIDTNAANGTLRVYGKVNAADARVKLTNGVEIITTAIPDSWRQERADFSGTQIYIAVIRDQASPQNHTTSLSLVYADGSSSTSLNALTDNFQEKPASPGKEISCISLYLPGNITFDVTLRICVTQRGIADASGFICNETARYPLPELPAFGNWAEAQKINLAAGGMAVVRGGYPQRVIAGYRGDPLRRFPRAKYVLNVPKLPYTAPDTFSFLPAQEVNALTFDGLYQLYDALITADGKYASKTLMGKTYGGKNIYKYVFRPARAQNTTGAQPEIPKITLTAGIHGDEKAGWYATYLLFREMVTGWKGSELFEFLRFNVEFQVVPLINSRLNRLSENNVNTNRNTYANWLHVASGQDASGAFAGSEPETQAVYRFLQDNLNSDFHIDVHNFWAGDPPLLQIFLNGENGSCIKLDAVGRVIQSLASTISETTYHSLQRRYESVLGSDYSTVNTKVQFSSVPGGSILMQARNLGIPGFTLETKALMEGKPGAVNYDETAQRMSLEHLVNSILAVLGYLCK